MREQWHATQGNYTRLRIFRGYTRTRRPRRARFRARGTTHDADSHLRPGRLEKPPETVALHSTAIVRYRCQVEDLQAALSSGAPGDHQEPIRALRELVAAILVMPTSPGESLKLEVRGRLAAVIGHDVFPAARMWGGKMVAEEGL